MVQGGFVVVRRKGVPEAGAIFIHIDRLDGTGQLFGPAPPSMDGDDDGGRRFVRLHTAETIENNLIDQRLMKETKFDPDCWIIDVEDRSGRSFLEGSLN